MRTKTTRATRMLAFIAGLMMASGLAACSPVSPPITSQPSTDAVNLESLRREDNQGAVTVQVTPLNLTSPAATLDFSVTLDTHTVDLSMDLAQLATLKTDSGVAVPANPWPIGSGHHYEGTLSFPAQTADGKSVLDSARKITLVIKGLDVPERIFEWDLSK